MNLPATNAVPTARVARLSVALLLAINLFNYVDRYVLAAVSPRIRAAFLSSADEQSARFWIGTLATAFLAAYMLAAPVFGLFANRLSRWKLIGMAVMVWSLASGASGLATTFNLLFLTRLLVGIGEAAYGPTAPTLIADLFPVERRVRVMSWFYMAIPVGSALGYFWGGKAIRYFDGVYPDHVLLSDGWRWAFYLVVPPGMLLGLLCFLMPEPARGAVDAPSAPNHRLKWADFRTLLRTPSYVLNTLGMMALTFAIGGVSYWIPDYVNEFRGEPDLEKVNSTFGALTVLAGIMATLGGGYAAHRLSAKYSGAFFVVSGVAMLLAFPCFLMALRVPLDGVWEFWALVFLTEVLLFFNTGPTNTILVNVTHPSIRETAFGLNILVIHLLGDAISPPLIGWLTDRAGGNMNVGFQAVSAAILVGGICWLCGARHLERDTKLAPTRIAQ